MLASFYMFSPRYYLIDKKGVTISRLVGPIPIPFEEVCDFEMVANVRLCRLIGSGGLFSHYGTYLQNNTKVKVYATHYSQMIRISTSKMTYYISPDDPESFIKYVKKRWDRAK